MHGKIRESFQKIINSIGLNDSRPNEIALSQLANSILEILELKEYILKFSKSPFEDSNSCFFPLYCAQIIKNNEIVVQGFSIRSQELSLVEAFERLIMINNSFYPLQKEFDEAIDLDDLKLKILDENTINALHFNNNSTGWSVHSNFSDAIMNGIFEIVERDVLLRNWYGEISPNRIEINNVFHREFNEIQSYGFETFQCFFKTNENICVSVTLICNKEKKLFYLGAGSHPELIVSLKKSLQECFQEFYYKYIVKIKSNTIAACNDQDIFNEVYDYFVLHSKLCIDLPLDEGINSVEIQNKYQFFCIPIILDDDFNKYADKISIIRVFSNDAARFFSSNKINGSELLYQPQTFVNIISNSNRKSHPYW